MIDPHQEPRRTFASGSPSKGRGVVFRWMTTALVGVVLLGCTWGTSDSEDNAGEHGFSEHLPPHFPANLRIAIERLLAFTAPSNADSRERLGDVASTEGTDISELSRIIDTIGWLPLLCADSDVDEQTFLQVDELASSFQQLRDHAWPQANWEEQRAKTLAFIAQQRPQLERVLRAYRSVTFDPDDSDGPVDPSKDL